MLVNDLIVGYHVWLDDHRVLLFVLGEPATLQVYDLNSGQHKIVGTSPGRSLHRIPQRAQFSFVEKGESGWSVRSLDPATLQTDHIFQAIPGHEDIAWLPNGWIISSDGNKLMVFKPGGHSWEEVAFDAGLKGITRLAVEASGKHIAIVASE